MPEQRADDDINHPKRYNSDPSGVECIEVVEKFPHNTSRALEYVWRSHLKGSAVSDLQKSLWYLNRAYEKREPRPLEEHGPTLKVIYESDNEFLRAVLYHLIYPYKEGRMGIRCAFAVVRIKLEALGGTAPGPYLDGLVTGKDPQ